MPVDIRASGCDPVEPLRNHALRSALACDAMRVLIFHGYLLRGTGSNVYNASLARALARLGHEVHLLCQDREAGALDWVDGFGRWTDGRLRVELGAGGSPPGSVTVYVPDIGGLFPSTSPTATRAFG